VSSQLTAAGSLSQRRRGQPVLVGQERQYGHLPLVPASVVAVSGLDLPRRDRRDAVAPLFDRGHPAAPPRLYQDHQVARRQFVSTPLHDGARVVGEVLHADRHPLRVEDDLLDDLAVVIQIVGRRGDEDAHGLGKSGEAHPSNS
jgi:hypothetical protein